MPERMAPRNRSAAALSHYLPPLFDHLHKMRVLCPFAVDPAAYQVEHALAVSCFCWFTAERHLNGLSGNLEKQILSACLTPGAFAGCRIYHSVKEV